MRIETGVRRGAPFEITVNGQAVVAYPGETLATLLLANGWLGGGGGQDAWVEGVVFCNLGACCQCLVIVETAGAVRRVRACLVDAAPGQSVRLPGKADD